MKEEDAPGTEKLKDCCCEGGKDEVVLAAPGKEKGDDCGCCCCGWPKPVVVDVGVVDRPRRDFGCAILRRACWAAVDIVGLSSPESVFLIVPCSLVIYSSAPRLGILL